MLSRSDFPAGFLFGAATSAYQIEGQRFGGAGPTHWDAFARRPGAIADGSDGSVACDHYHRFEEDLDYLRGLDAYRFSLNWARILPTGRGTANPEGIDFYDRLLDAILARGLQPFATLYHWELPQALAECGGWRARDTAMWFGDYAELVARRFGDRLASIATLNEPFCTAWLGHFEGVHAPGIRDIAATGRVMHNLLLAHGEAIARLRDHRQTNLGIVLNFAAIRPENESPENLRAAETRDAIFNRWFLEAIASGRYPDAALAGLGPHLPDGWQDDMSAITAPLDWLGVNYYTREIIAHDPRAPWPAARPVPGPLPKTAMGWEIYPDGLYEILMRVNETTGGMPILITENGMARDDRRDDDKVDDPERLDFISAHLDSARRAIADGVDLRGFFYWSLLDNFEWAYGYTGRFGLIHVEQGTLQRTPKSSYRALMQAFSRQG